MRWPAVRLHQDITTTRSCRALVEEFSYKNPMEVPRLDKIVINMGVGDGVGGPRRSTRLVRRAGSDGRFPVSAGGHEGQEVGRGFKLREGMPVGCKVTLRREADVRVLDRLITIALPRVRDFRGLSRKSFDGGGNYSPWA